MTDKVGLLNTAFAALAAKTMFSNKSGIAQSINGGMSKFVSGFFSNETSNPLADAFKDTGDAAEEAVEQLSFFNDAQGETGAVSEAAGAGVKILANAQNSQAGAAGTAGKANVANAATETMVGTAAEAASWKVRLLTSALTFGISLIAGFVIEKALKGLDNWIHRVENLRDEVNSLTDEYKKAKNEFSENLTSLTTSLDADNYSSLEEEFAVLTRGVNKYGENISLTSDQYERYKKICEKIVGIQPSIAEGYNSATEAIGNNASILSQLIELQKQQARQNAQEFTNDKNMKKQTDNAVNAYKEAKEKVSKYINYNGAEGIHGISSLLYEVFDWNNVGTKVFGDTSSNADDLASKVLKVIGYTDEQVSEKLKSYYKNGYFQYNEWITDYADEIASNKEKIADAIKSSSSEFDFEDRSEDFRSWADSFKTVEKDAEEAKNNLVNTFLQVPSSMSEYDKLSKSTQSFITEWIKNSDMFKIDENTTQEQVLKMRDQIKQFVRGLADGDYTTELSDGTTITANDILDQMFSIDSSTINFEDYKKKIQELVDLLWNAIGGENNTLGYGKKEDLGISLGFKPVYDDSQEKAFLDRVEELGIATRDEAQKYLNNLPADKRQLVLDFDLSATKKGDYSGIFDLVNKILEKSSASTSPTTQSYSDLKDAVDKFNEILSQTEEIVADNTTVSQDYKDSLTRLGLSQEELNDVFDKSNPLLVKNAALLRKLVTQKKEEKRATIQAAKAQTQLQYRNTVKQLQQVVAAMGKEYKATGLVTDATRKSVDVLRSQLTALRQAQREYALLEIQLSGATNAYENFEKAKELDSKLTYGDSMIEMLNTINDGFKTGQVGTEAFQAAVKTLVPSSVYEDLDNFNDRMVAIHDYIDKNPLFADWFTIKDGEFSITQKNIQSFVDDAQKAGAFTASDENGNFFLADGVDTIDKFVEKINEGAEGAGVTKEAVVAMLTEFAKYDASWSDILSDLTTNKFDKAVNDQTKALEKATLAKAEYLKAGGEYDKDGNWVAYNTDRWNELCKAEEDATTKLNEATAATQANASKYIALETIYNSATGKLKLTTDQAKELAKALGLGDVNFTVDDNGTIQLTAEQAEILNQKKKELAEPTVMSAQFDFDSLSKQLAAAKAYINNPNELSDDDKTILLNAGIDIDNLSSEDAKAQVNKLIETITPQLNTIQLKYGITKTTDEQQDDGTIEKLQKWESDGMQFTVSAETEEAKKKVDDLNAEKDKLSEPEMVTLNPEVDPVAKTVAEKQLDDVAKDRTAHVYVETVDNTGSTTNGGGGGSYSTNHGRTGLNGTANASGTWGSDKSDTSLVGELGPELRVRGNRWDMLGENGAEFTDVKKGDIIFNHKQTKSLLENGYINSRGKAYASGTSYGISNIFDKLKLNKLAKYAEEMCKQYEELVNGNVDLRKRPHLSPSYEHDLAMGGGYNSFIGSDGEIYASTSAETVTIGDKNKYTIDITPVLENGDVLTSDALADYIDGLVTDGSTQDLLDSDKYNLVIRAVPGEYDEKDWAGFEDELSKYKDDYLNTIMEMFNLGGDKAVESSGFSSVGLAGVVKDLQDNGSYTGKEVASAIDNTSDGMRELDNLINQYVTDVLNAKSLADDIGTDLSQTKYGNVDTNNRQKLYWDEESIDKYGDAIDSWGMKADDLANTYSTLLSSVGEFDGEDIAFTPILQTENGPQLLDSSTVDKYIWGLIDEAKQNDGKWTSDELFQLDTEGLEVDGVVVKNLLEGIGQDADKTAKLLHYVGDTGAIANLEGEIESTSSELVATGENINAVQEKLDKLNATSISDKTFTVTTDYRIIGSGTEQTVHTPGASGRLTIYADGSAHASGDWGLKQSEHNSLVGELGTETVVDPHTGKYYTVGDKGAELVDLPKDAIIFNHKQTEQLFKNGHIGSRGKMIGGQAFAEGNAHYGLFTGYTDYDEVFKNGSNDWVEAWDDTLRSISDAADSISGAGDDLSDAADDFEELFDWFAVLLEEIDDDLNYVSAKLENAVGISAKNNLQDEMININKLKLTELGEGYKLYADYAAELLGKVPEQYRNLAEQGGVALTKFLGEANQEVVEAINNYREWAQKAADVRTQQQEVKKEITSISLQKVQTIADEYDRVITKITTMNDLIQANIDLIDEQGEHTSAVMYEEMIKNSSKQLDELKKQREAMQKEFDAQVSSGNIEVGSEAWYEGISAIQDVDKSIIDCRKDIESFQNSINQLHWDNFDKLIDAIDNVGTELSNLGDLIDDDDAVDEMGNWTDKGITKMGLLAQEMERAQYRAQQYAEQIDYLNQEYAAGKYSTDEYNEKLQELKDGQWDSIKSYEAAKDAIVDLNKARVESAKNAIQKEIDAYSDLISKKKEELQLTKDAHDFSKQVAESQKNIANIEKQLAAISGDNSAAAVAKRKKLQAELAAAQEELDELYYSHNVEQQQDALDKNLEDYQDEKDKEMEKLDEYLKNVEQVIADSFATITGNTETVAETLKGIADEYGINLSEAITSPWEQGSIAIGTYQEQLDTSISAFTQQLEGIKQKLIDLQTEADKTARSLVEATNQQAKDTSSATYTPPTPSSTPSTPSTPSKPAAPSVGSSVTVKKSATNFSRDGGNGTRMQSWVPGTTFTVYQTTGSEVLIGRNGGYTGWVRLSDIEGYRLGVNGVKKNQLAITDEDGLEELVLHAGVNGKLQYLSKGSSVIPSDITENLMELGQLDPRQVLERNMPKIGAPYIVNNNTEINMQIAEVVHIDHADSGSISDISKAVQKQMDSYMKNINSSLKRYTR